VGCLVTPAIKSGQPSNLDQLAHMSVQVCVSENVASLPIAETGGDSMQPCSTDVKAYRLAGSNRVSPQQRPAKGRFEPSQERRFPPFSTAFLKIFSGLFREQFRQGRKWARIRPGRVLVRAQTGALKRGTGDASPMPRAVTTLVRAWFVRDEGPPASGVSMIETGVLPKSCNRLQSDPGYSLQPAISAPTRITAATLTAKL
jgi:hypothetical protein